MVLKKGLCLFLILTQVGCRSVYRFRCTCDPSPAGVVIRDEMMGETPCTVEIPRDSDLIQDGRIEFRFCRPYGPERTRVVDLARLKPSNPLAEAVAAPFMFVGAGVFLVAAADNEVNKDSHAVDDWDKDRGDSLIMGLAGLGVMGIGAGLYHLLGGRSESLDGCDVHMDFNEPASAGQATSANTESKD